MAKKQFSKESVQENQYHALQTGKPDGFGFFNLLPLFVSILYCAVFFVPHFDGFDAFGSQWFYIVIIDLLVIVYILAKKNEYDFNAQLVFSNSFSKIYLVFFAIAGLSIFTSINATEAVVCFVRIVATIIAFFNMAILFRGQLHLFKWLAQILAIILGILSIQSIAQFLSGFEATSLNQLIKEIQGNAGNKNIFSAALVILIPFTIYCIQTSDIKGKILNCIILLSGTLTLFLLNTRAAFLSLIFILLVYILYCFLEYKKEKKGEKIIYRISFIAIPIIAALLISQLLLSTALNLQDSNEKQLFGTVADRLGTISNTSDEANNVRFRLWAHAIDYTIHHPIIGCGIGNWKIASIPYQKKTIDDLFVPVHAHNDFFEMFAELGMIGGILYLALFISILIFTLKVYFSNSEEQLKLISVFSFLAFIGYSIDAFFNFPIERPISQILFALIAAININVYLTAKKDKRTPLLDSSAVRKTLFGIAAVILLLPSAYVTYQTYKSLVAQKNIIPDMGNEPLKLKWNEIIPLLPSIPNLSASAQPLDAIKGRYLMEAEKYKEALVLLNRAIPANPYIAYSEFIKAGVFFKLGNFDSAYINASKAFYTKPRAKTYYQTLIAILAKRKDTIQIEKAYHEVVQYRQEPYVWNLYILGMLNAKEKGSQQLLQLTDSVLKLFPENPDLLLRRKEILMFMSAPAATRITASDGEKAQAYYNQAIKDFGEGQAAANKNDEALKRKAYTSAIKNFLKAAEMNPNNFIIFENTAIAYFNMGEFNKSLIYFNKVFALQTATDGKSEYFAGVALYNTGKKEEGCNYLKVALSKGWKDAEPIIKNNCK